VGRFAGPGSVSESALDLTRPGRVNEGDELGLACIAARSTYDFLDPTGSRGSTFYITTDMWLCRLKTKTRGAGWN
jgi:hypothetical protein